MKPPLHLIPIVSLTCSTQITNVLGKHYDEHTNRRKREPSRVKLSTQHTTERRTQQVPSDLIPQLETILGHPIDESVQIQFIDNIDELELWDSSWGSSSSLNPTYSDWGSSSSSSSKSGKSSKGYKPSGKSQKGDVGKSGKGTRIPSPTMSPNTMISQPSLSPMKEMPSSAPSRIDNIVDLSSKPSNAQSETSSEMPSETLSTIPSQSPTLRSSEAPSAIPSGMPSLHPSESPSGLPTRAPSSMPSVNISPTLKPVGKFAWRGCQ